MNAGDRVMIYNANSPHHCRDGTVMRVNGPPIAPRLHGGDWCLVRLDSGGLVEVARWNLVFLRPGANSPAMPPIPYSN